MALKPVLKLKVDELFLRWLSDSDIQRSLKINLHQIRNGDAVTQNQSQHYGINSVGKSNRPMSPRVRPGSPSTPPCSPPPGKVQSPRSPRRSFASRVVGKQVSNRENELNAREKEINAKDNKQKDTATKDKDVFLKQKEAQLKEKREREARENFSDKRDNKSSSQQRTQGQTPPPTHIQTLQHKPQLRNAGKPENIPQFYFPMGRPVTGEQQEKIVQRIKEAFSKFENGKVTSGQMGAIAKACQLSFYWRCPLFLDAGGQKTGFITLQMFLSRWKKLCQTCHDDAAKFVALLSKPGCNYLVAEDFIPLIQDVVDTHPGLTFLHDAPEFHSRYVHTVIARIFYCVNRSWTGRLTPAELRRSNLLQVLQLVEEEDDINRITDYFSYEHFYVIYCKFWELDTDHDLFISKEDLSRHNEHAISTRMIERIFSGAVTRGHAQKEGKMSYTEFVWFLLSEEDKRHPTSIEYWFRCMDLDGDGVLSMYELEYFYEEQVQKMEALGIETLPFEDCLCQADTVVPAVCDHPFVQETVISYKRWSFPKGKLTPTAPECGHKQQVVSYGSGHIQQMLDMVSPRETGKITMRDLKACKMTPLFYDTFFNLEKYLDHEQKDPFANARDHESDEPEMSDWERYAAEEYEILVAEEGANDLGMDEINYEDDFEPDDEEMQTLPVEALQLAEPPQRKGRPRPTSPDDDIYDFSNKDLGY